MTRVYELAPVPGHESVSPARPQDREALASLDKWPQIYEWRRGQVRILRPSSMALHSDILLGCPVPILRRRAREALEPLVAGAAELLPLRTGKLELWALHVTRMVSVSQLGSGAHRSPEGRIDRIFRYHFREGMVNRQTVFLVVPEPDPTSMPELRGRIFWTQKVVDAVLEANLAGVGFRLIWMNDREAAPVTADGSTLELVTGSPGLALLPPPPES